MEKTGIEPDARTDEWIEAIERGESQTPRNIAGAQMARARASAAANSC